MARRPRAEVAPGRYHVYARGNDRMTIYRDDIDRSQWLELLANLALRFKWRCEAWTLMTNHFHLLVETTEPNLGAGMQLLNGSYARGFNRRYGRINLLFGERYGSKPVQDDGQLLTAIRYIYLNAVVVDLCDRPEDWRWCTYAATIGVAAAPSFMQADSILAISGSGARARARLAAFVEAELATQPLLPGAR